MAGKLDPLLSYLDGLTGRAPLAELVHELSRLDVTCEDVAEHIRFNDRQYARNLIKAGPWYFLLALCWKNGQRSPVHDHASCGAR
jgi:cysteine dioxygenase